MGWFNRKKEPQQDKQTVASVDFDTLIAAAEKSGNPSTQGPIWKAIFELSSWHFLGDPQRPTAPVIAVQRGQPAVYAFTDPQHAERYAQKARLLSENNQPFHIPMPVGQAKAFLTQLAERGVQSIVFNPEPVGLGAELKQFLSEADRALQHQVARFFDDLVMQAQMAGGGEAYSRVWAAAMKLPKWHFVGDAKMPDRPYVGIVNEEPAVFAFTDESNALRFAMKEQLQRPDGSISLISYRVDDAVTRLVKAHQEQGVPRVVFNSESKYFVGYLKDFTALQKKSVEARPKDALATERAAAAADESSDFDQLAAECRSSGSREGMDRLWGAVYRLKKWYFVARGQIEPNTIHAFVGEVDGNPFVFAFTDELRANAFAVRQNLQMSEGAYPILSMQTPAATDYVNRLAEQGVFGILFNDGPNGFFAPIANVIPMARYFGLPDLPTARDVGLTHEKAIEPTAKVAN